MTDSRGLENADSNKKGVYCGEEWKLPTAFWKPSVQQETLLVRLCERCKSLAAIRDDFPYIEVFWKAAFPQRRWGVKCSMNIWYKGQKYENNTQVVGFPLMSC